MLMPKPSWSRVPQLELFRPAFPTPTMPSDVYRKTVQLLARLLREHTHRVDAIRAGREAGHE
jgi:hypothetical protein